MAEMPWSKFFWSDWESDQGLRLCSLAAQGLWMRMLCVCARHEPKGYLSINGNPLTVDDIARLAGVAETEAETLVAELERKGVFSRNRTGCIYSRRMVKDEKRSQEGRKHKKRGLKEASENKGENPVPSRGPARGASPQKPEARSQIYDGDGDTRAREREPDRVLTFRERLIEAMGGDPVTGITGPSCRVIGTQVDMAEANGWIAMPGMTEDVIVAEVQRISAGRPPPNSFRYFTRAMRELSGALSAPAVTPIRPFEPPSPQQQARSPYAVQINAADYDENGRRIRK